MLGERGRQHGPPGDPLQAGGGDAGEAAPGKQELEEQSAPVQRALHPVPRVRAAAQAPPAAAGGQGGHDPGAAGQPGPGPAAAAAPGAGRGCGGRGAGALAGGESAGAAGPGPRPAPGQRAALGAQGGGAEPGTARGARGGAQHHPPILGSAAGPGALREFCPQSWGLGTAGDTREPALTAGRGLREVEPLGAMPAPGPGAQSHSPGWG